MNLAVLLARLTATVRSRRRLALSVCALCVGRSRVQKECRSASDECRPLLLRPSSMHGGGRRWRYDAAHRAEDECEDTATMPNVREGKDEQAGNMLHRREPDNRAGGGDERLWWELMFLPRLGGGRELVDYRRSG